MENTGLRPIKGYEGFYSIDTSGNVFSLTRNVVVNENTRLVNGRCLKPRINNCGYLSVRLSKDGTTRTSFIHRLLAESFIANPEKLPLVNHIDGNKLNNRIANLEWCTHSHNIRHGFLHGLCRIPEVQRKKVQDICTGRTFASIKEASVYHSIPYSTMKNYLSGRRRNRTKLKIVHSNIGKQFEDD